jgi:hypothetical protein
VPQPPLLSRGGVAVAFPPQGEAERLRKSIVRLP